MKKALALILALLMLCSTSAILASAADIVDIDMLAVAEAAGYKAAYAGAPINNGPTLDGKIEEGEYTATRTIAHEDLFSSSNEIQSDVTEYFAHNENFVYYAIQFVQADDNRALMPNFKVSNTFDIYKDSSTLANYFRYRMGAAQFRYGASSFYHTNPAASHDGGQAAPVFRDDIVANAAKDANNVKTYEIRFSKAYFANLLGLEDMSELRVIPYYFYFHSSCAVASIYTNDIVDALTEKLADVAGSWIPPVGEGAYYFMVLDDEVNEDDEWEVFHNDLGWNVYVGEALTSNQKLDGKIGVDEYTFSRVLDNTSKNFSATTGESDVIEYLAHDADFVYYAVQFKETAGNKACRIDFHYSNSTVYQYAGAHLYQYGVAGTWITDTVKVYPRLYGNGVIHDDNAIGNSCTGVGAPDPTLSYVNNGVHTGKDGVTPTAFGADLSMAGSVDSNTNVKIYEFRFDKSYFIRSNSRKNYVHMIETPNMNQLRELSWQLWFHGTGAFTGYDPTNADFKAAILAAGGDEALASKYTTSRLPMFYILDEAPEGYYDEGEGTAKYYPTSFDGASVRISATNSGLRFKTNISTAVVDAFVAKYGKENVKIGTLIAPEDTLTGDLTIDTAVKVDVPATIDAPFAQANGVSTYAGSLTNIKQTNLGRNFTAVGYIAYFDGAEWNYTYSISSTTRSVSAVAQAALNHQEEVQKYNDENPDTPMALPYSETALGIIRKLVVA